MQMRPSIEDLSPALRMLESFWSACSRDSWQVLNQGSYDVLRLAISCQAEFHEDDFSVISKHYRPGYWFGVSLNGKHHGEGLYAAACQNHEPAAISYEKHYGRVPFILGGKRVFEGAEIVNGLFWRVTGWDVDNKSLSLVGRSSRHDRSNKGAKRITLSRDEWLKWRKDAKWL